MKRTFYYGLLVFLFYVIFSTIAVLNKNPNPLMASITITVLTFFWFRISVNWEKFFTMSRDVFVNIIVYTIILSIVASMSMVFSRDAINIMNVGLYLSPVILWFIVWTDYYFQRMNGRF